MNYQILLIALFSFLLSPAQAQSCLPGEIKVGGNCICQLPGVKFNNSCNTTCPSSYYLDSRAQTCIKCSYGCSLCSETADKCITCHSGFSLSNGKCSCINSGYIFESSSPCTGRYPIISNNTEVCITCLTSCPSGYYYDAYLHKCSNCHSNCANCTGPASSQCLTCRTGLYYNPYSRTCQSSCFSGSMSADSEGFCVPVTCTGTINFFNMTTGSCSSTCASGTINLGYTKKLCGSCSSLCGGTCFNQSSSALCQNCLVPNSSVLSTVAQSTLLDTIPIYQCTTGITNFTGLAYSTKYNSYIKCHPMCGSCTSQVEVCLSCANSSDYLTEQGTCISTCYAPSYNIETINGVTYCLANPNLLLENIQKIATNSYKVAKVIVPVFLILSQMGDSGISSIMIRLPYLNMYIILRYFKINYPKYLYNHFNDISPFDNAIPFSLPESWSDLSSFYPAPDRYARYGLKGLFLTNFWPFFCTFAIIFVVTMIFVTIKIDRGFNFEAANVRMNSKLNSFFVWNYILSYYYYMIFPAAFFIVIEYQSLSGDMNSYCILSFISGLVFTIFTLLFSCKKLIPTVQEANQDGKVQIENHSLLATRFKFLFLDFKPQNTLSTYFIFIIQARLIMVAISSTLPGNQPLLQTGFMVCCNIFMIVGVIHSKPYKSRIKNIEIVMYEISSLGINSMAFLLGYYDFKDKSTMNTRNSAYDSKESLSTAILFVISILCLFTIIFSFLELVGILEKIDLRSWIKTSQRLKAVSPAKEDNKSTGEDVVNVTNLEDSTIQALSPKKEIPIRSIKTSSWESRAFREGPGLRISIPE